MKRKILPWIIISTLGLALILFLVNSQKATESSPNKASYNEVKIRSLSVYDYRPIFISSLGEKRYLIENVDEIKVLVRIIERAKLTNLRFKDDFGKYDYQVSINEDTGDIQFCFKIDDNKDEVFIEKRFDTNKVYQLRKQDIEEFRKIFEKLQG